MKRVMWLGLSACALAAFSATPFSPGGEGEKPRPDAGFTAKVLMVYVKDPAKGAVLGDVRVRLVGHRPFLVGKMLARDDGADSAWNKAMHWVAVDDVVEMFEFSNIEDARKAQAEADQKRPQGR
jgi:hypothetical protein